MERSVKWFRTKLTAELLKLRYLITELNLIKNIIKSYNDNNNDDIKELYKKQYNEKFKEYLNLCKEIKNILEQIFEEEKANKLPINFSYRILYKKIKSVVN